MRKYKDLIRLLLWDIEHRLKNMEQFTKDNLVIVMLNIEEEIENEKYRKDIMTPSTTWADCLKFINTHMVQIEPLYLQQMFEDIEHNMEVAFGKLDDETLSVITFDEDYIEKEWNDLWPDDGFPTWVNLSPKERNDYRFGNKFQDKMTELKEDMKDDRFETKNIRVIIDFVLEEE